MFVNFEIDGMSMIINNNFDLMVVINFFDIESVIVLKDVVVIVIYGLCVVNGVIVIIIKKGKEGKMSINLDIK